MKNFYLLFLGMAFQAFIAGTLHKLEFIKLSVGQQLTAGMMFLIVAFVVFLFSEK